LDDISLKGAKGVLINITGGRDLTLYEVDEAASLIREQVDEDANIIVGSALDDDLDGIIRVSVVATGVDSEAGAVKPPVAFTTRTASPKANVVDLPVSEKASETSVDQDPQDRFADYNPVANMQREVAEEFSRPKATTPPPYVAPRPYPPKMDTPAAYNEAVVEPSAPQPIPESAASSLKKTALGGLFGRRKKSPTPVPQTQTTKAPVGDLFSEDMEDELQIPSFLRRQSR